MRSEEDEFGICLEIAIFCDGGNFKLRPRHAGSVQHVQNMLFFSFATEVEGEKNANNAFVSIVDLAWPPDIDASDV